MAPWAAPAVAAALLLVATGATKVVRPLPSAAALPLPVSLRASTVFARLLGLAELTVGLAVLLVGGRLVDALMAATFVAFAGFAYFALRSDAPSCGCTGADDTPPSPGHIVMNLAFAGLAGLSAGSAEPSAGSALLHGATDPVGVVVVAITATVVWLAWMVLELGALRPLHSGQKGRTT